ncbi:MAG TPA: hypothetical protein VMW65_08455 [Chloroflexota bacterium]|nr:hypothetical protein [Chloroflexota bacterium]
MSSRKKPKRSASVNGKISLPTNGAVLTPHSGRPPGPAPSPVKQRMAVLVTLASVLFALSGIFMVTTLRTDLSSLLPWATKPPAPFIDGIACETSANLPYQIHAHLAILDNGQPVTIPAGVGVVPGSANVGASSSAPLCTYWLNTTDTSGIINVQAPAPHTLNLGQFFDVWHQPLTTNNVAGHTGPVTVFVDQKPYIGDPSIIDLTNHMNITLEVGKTVPPPPNDTFAGK